MRIFLLAFLLGGCATFAKPEVWDVKTDKNLYTLRIFTGSHGSTWYDDSFVAKSTELCPKGYDILEKSYTPTTLHKNNVRLMMIGDLTRLPEKAREKMLRCIAQTSANTGLALVLALSYSSRWEIVNAVKNICKDVEDGKYRAEDINDELFSDHLTTKSIPDPDLLIRTSGEERISNFLLWQIAYTELYFTQTHWPAFRKENLYHAIYEFQQRERRFGK